MNEDQEFPESFLQSWAAPAPRGRLAERIIAAALAQAARDPIVLIFPPVARLPVRARPWLAAGCVAACLLLGVFTGSRMDVSTGWSSGEWEAFLMIEEDVAWL